MKKYFGLLLSLMFVSLNFLQAQVMMFQYRHVSDENYEEFMKRETTYWSQVAKKAIDEGKMESWAVLERVGGYDMPHSPNVLFINMFEDLEAASGAWDPGAVFPDMKMEDMETNSLSTTYHQFYLSPRYWEDDSTAKSEDYKFVKINYWLSSNPGAFISLENEHWAPFVNAAMDMGAIDQVGWGNATLLSPRGPHIPFNTISMDFYSSLQETLMPQWPSEESGLEIPEAGMDKLAEITEGRVEEIYRIVKAENKE